MKRPDILIVGTWGLLAGLIFFASVRGSPYLADASLMPQSLGRLVDSFPVARHFVAYLGFTLLSTAVLVRRPGAYRRIWMPLALTVAAGALEFLQRFMPARSADWADFGASALGIWAAWSAVKFGPALWQLARRIDGKRKDTSVR